jgi:hypothetical protein
MHYSVNLVSTMVRNCIISETGLDPLNVMLLFWLRIISKEFQERVIIYKAKCYKEKNIKMNG